MAASTAAERWICFRFQMLKPISAAAGSTMASSSCRRVRVRSVNRHFLSTFSLTNPLGHPNYNKTIKTFAGQCVKPSQRVVKSCKTANGANSPSLEGGSKTIPCCPTIFKTRRLMPLGWGGSCEVVMWSQIQAAFWAFNIESSSEVAPQDTLQARLNRKRTSVHDTIYSAVRPKTVATQRDHMPAMGHPSFNPSHTRGGSPGQRQAFCSACRADSKG